MVPIRMGLYNRHLIPNRSVATRFVSQELSARIVFASSVALVWKDLQERYEKVDSSRVIFLHCEIASHLELLWDEYDALVPFSCTSENSRKNQQLIQQQWLFQFLMGLNDS
ncbi:UBN2_3 domain-containing protein [Gossypium australe]|uniref:UBN2_3 domain-containing protein n=1 Tax=Gossypium australe TaxID=47621 RepID=A0A5B6VTI5_9ROSI|nr:UBN2_3 domain-containing protein [Gossypium australe]